MAAPSRLQLANMVAAKEAAKARDHRVLGTSMGLFFFDNVSPGSAFFTPIGTRLYNALLHWMREIYKVRTRKQLCRFSARPYCVQQVCGYSEVITPQIFKRSLWETSGHWQVRCFPSFKLKCFECNPHAWAPAL
jgi:threonyl-tRNA synthetase